MIFLLLGKHIFTVSDQTDMNSYHRKLLRELEKLISEQIFDLSLVDHRHRDEVFCLFTNLNPLLIFYQQGRIIN